MQSENQTVPVSKTMFRAGVVISALPTLLLLFSAIMKFFKPAGMEEGMAHLGWKMEMGTSLGILELICTVLYIIPQTSVLGAILLTGYLGGAVAAHVRVGDPWFVQVILGILVWLGLFLREPRLRSLLPLRS